MRCECGRRVWPWQNRAWNQEEAAYIHAACAEEAEMNDEPEVRDYRPREVRTLHAIFEKTPEQIRAWNLGVLYAADGKEDSTPAYGHADMSEEAAAFWEGVNWANPRVAAAIDKRLDDLFGPEDEGAQQHG